MLTRRGFVSALGYGDFVNAVTEALGVPCPFCNQNMRHIDLGLDDSGTLFRDRLACHGQERDSAISSDSLERSRRPYHLRLATLYDAYVDIIAATNEEESPVTP